MSQSIDLRQLAEQHTPQRAYLSVYLNAPLTIKELEKKLTKIGQLLKKGSPAEKDEKEYFDENVKLVREHLKANPPAKGSLCLFAGWVNDFFQAIPLVTKVEELIRVDSSPFLRPLARQQEEYEDVAVVITSNKDTRIFLVSATVAAEEESIKGNIKNHVKKGGWSQQRYERRRDKQLLLYAKEIALALQKLNRETSFRRIIMVGSVETIRSIEQNLPGEISKKVISRAADTDKGAKLWNEDIMEIFINQERLSEEKLWEKIRVQVLQSGLGVLGLQAVYQAAREGRISEMLVQKDYKPAGTRCRDCEQMSLHPAPTCPACGSSSLFEVDVVNEIVELLKLSGAEVDFSETMEGLAAAGSIAALLRY